MKKDVFKNKLVDFIKKSSCSYTCIKEIKDELIKYGYKELFEYNKWNKLPLKFFAIRNDASIVAVDISNMKNDSYSIITTHCDTPALLLKPNGAYVKENYLKYNIMPYGGLLNMGWLDHPLSIAGRICYEKDHKITSKIIDLKKPICIVPSVAIHQDSKANTNLDLNMQIDLQPILALSKNSNTWNRILKDDHIIDYDLFLYNPIDPVFIGPNDEILVSPRIDNLTSVFASLNSFLISKSGNIKVFCSFNNEEVGSLTEEGADSNFLLDILKKVAGSLNIDIASSLSKSFIISSDNTHAVHPNHTEFADDTGSLYLSKGFAIIREPSSTTNSLSSSIIKLICNKSKIKYQDGTSKNDISGGSTLSGISLRHVSVLSVDVGIPQLSMHSSVESCSFNDVYELYKMMKTFYQTNIAIKKDTILID